MHLGKDRPRRTTEHYTSEETTVTIPYGSPVVFSLSGTKDGGLVEAPESGGTVAVSTQLIAGVALQDVAPGETGEFAVNGFVQELRVIRGYRTASTVTYASSPAIAVGDHLDLHKEGNGVSRATAAESGALHPFIALESKASSASAATTTSDTSTLRVDRIKAFIRLM